jgi:hypothetical protein
MEISLKYILVQLECLIHPIFVFIYLTQFTVTEAVKDKIVIEDRVRILTGVCISIYYIYKLILLMRTGPEMKDLDNRVSKLEKENKTPSDN